MEILKTTALLCTLLCFMHQSRSAASLSQDLNGKKEDVYMLLDCSRSMYIYDISKLLNWLADLVSAMDIGQSATRVGLGLYSETHHVHIPINNTLSKSELIRRIKDTTCHERGDTYISRAIEGMMTDGLSDRLVRKDVPHVCVLTTDGKARHIQWTEENATLAKQRDIHMLTVGIGPDINKRQMEYIASEPKYKFAHAVANFEILAQDKDLKNRILTTMAKAESRRVNETACGWNKSIDTVLVYDGAALGTTTTSKLTNLFQHFADMIDMDSGNMRLSVYSRQCQGAGMEKIALNQYRKSATFKTGLDTLQEHPEGIQSLVKDARLHAFRKENGGRFNAEKRIVLVLDEPLARASKLYRQAHNAREGNVQVFVIYIGSVDEKLAWEHSYSPDTPSHTLLLNSSEDLDTQKAQNFFKNQFCNGLYS